MKMNSDYMARSIVARMYEVNESPEPASEYMNRNNPSNNYVDRAESIVKYSSGISASGIEKILKPQHPVTGYDGAKATEGDFSFAGKIIRDSLYSGRN
jgi:hypothetical protein